MWKFLTVLPLIAACAASPKHHESLHQETATFLVTSGGIPIECLESDITFPEGTPHHEGTTVLCEMVQMKDYAPCKLNMQTGALWCVYPPGYLWKPEQSF